MAVWLRKNNEVLKDSSTALTKPTPIVYWTPADIAGLAAWYDAQDADTFTLTSNVVDEWRDKSGNNRHCDSVLNTPTYDDSGAGMINGYPAVVFDGGNNSIATSAFSSGLGAAFVVYTSTVSSFGDYYGLLCHISTYSIFVGNKYGAPTGKNWLSDANTFASEVWIDGVKTLSNEPFDTAHIIAGNKQATQSITSGIKISGQFVAGRQWPGSVGEVILYDTVLSDADREEIQNYLAAKWGISV